MTPNDQQDLLPKDLKKKVIFTEHINRFFKEMKTYSKLDRLQYRTDIKAVMCKGIPDDEANSIKRAL